MKGKHHFLFASLLGVLLLLLAACGSGQTSSSSEQTSNQQSTGPSIVGKWTGICSLSDGIEFKQAEFDADGTLILDSYVAKYEVSGNQIRFIAPQATYQHSFSLSADGAILTLFDSSGGFCSVGRVGSNAVQEAAQSLLGVWSGTCQNLASFGSTFSRLEFKSDGTAVFDNDTSSPEQYNVPDAGHVSFPNLGIDQAVAWSFMVSGSTLTVTAIWISGPATCSLQKSA